MEHAKKIRRRQPASSATYRQIEKDLRQQISSGRWMVGAMFPSRRILANEYSVSLVTIARALQPLIDDGTLLSDNRRGTFIAKVSDTPSVIIAVAAESTREPIVSRGTAVSTNRELVIGTIAALYTERNNHDRQILQAVEQELANRNITTYFHNRARELYGPLQSLTESVEIQVRRGVDAIVLISVDMDRHLLEQTVQLLIAQQIPTVCILAAELTLPIPHVFYENRMGGFQAATHLIERGCKNITVVAPSRAVWATERIVGIRHAAEHAGLPPDAVREVAGEGRTWDYLEDSVTLGYNTSMKAARDGWRPSGGVICINDQVAYGVMQATTEIGLHPGRDFLLIGFDDDPRSRLVGLTTMRPPLEEMGREGARLLLGEIQGGQANHQLRLRAHVIPRASTSAIVPMGTYAGGF